MNEACDSQIFLYWLYRNNLKNRFLTASASPQNFCPHSCLASRQWSFAPDKNFEEPPCQIPDSSSCFGIICKVVSVYFFVHFLSFANSYRAFIHNVSEKLVFDCVGFFSKFSSSLAPCARTMVARSRSEF